MRSNIKSKHHDFHTNKNDNKTNKKHTISSRCNRTRDGRLHLGFIVLLDNEYLGDRSGWMGYITVMDQTDAHCLMKTTYLQYIYNISFMNQ